MQYFDKVLHCFGLESWSSKPARFSARDERHRRIMGTLHCFEPSMSVFRELV
jgi:hypothetical protein